MKENSKFSVCILCYGDLVSLAERCMESIADSLSEGTEFIQDIRIGLNQPSDGLKKYAQESATRIAINYSIPVLIYEPTPPESNTFKWPLMRRMFNDPGNPIADLIMWFDDDSYLTGQAGWWSDIHRAALRNPVIGSIRGQQCTDSRWAFIQSQPWADPGLATPVQFSRRGTTVIESFTFFPQGAWWTLQSQFIHHHDFPFPWLRHNGGDSLLGEYCRHQKLRLGVLKKTELESEALAYDLKQQGLEIEILELGCPVMINTDEDGDRDDSAPRKGYTENLLGFDYLGVQYGTEHQNFVTNVSVYKSGGTTEFSTIEPQDIDKVSHVS